jgi:glycosyltransferase involved in cell wall biosynthesis
MNKSRPKKKVLIVSSLYPRFPDGVAAQTTLYHNLLHLMKKYHTRMISLVPDDAEPIIPKDIDKAVDVLPYSDQHTFHGHSLFATLKAIRDHIHHYERMGNNVFECVKDNLYSRIVQYDPDFILFEQTGYSMIDWRRKLDRELHTKFLIRIHDPFPLHLEKIVEHSTSIKESIFLGMRKRRIATFEKKYIQDWDGILTHTAVEKQYYDKLSSFKVPVHVAPIGVDVHHLSVKHTQAAKDIDMVYIGAMRWRPNVDSVLWFYEHILPSLMNKIPNFRLAVVGRNPSRRILKLASDHVIVTGEVDDIREYAKRSKLSFCFSLSGSGIKKKIMELLAMGLPIVCDKESLQGYDAGKVRGVIIVDKNAIPNIVNTIVDLLENPELLEGMSRDAAETARQHFDYREISYDFETYVRSRES